MNKYIIALLTLLVIWAASISSQAQSGLSIRDVYGQLQEKRTFEPTSIAIEDAHYVGVDIIERTDSILMRNCTVILKNDLDFSPYFEIARNVELFMKSMELDWMTMRSWKTLGASYLIKLEIEFPRDRISVRYKLYSTIDGREIRKERFETKKNDYRALVHEIANDIIKALMGEEGIYRTKIVYSRKNDKGSELFISDFDGYNERQLTNNGSINILPEFSPDGKYVYFTSYLDDDPKIYMLTLETNEVDIFAGFPGLNTAPTVSPDGKQIACVLSKDGNSEIYLLDRKGNIKKRLTYNNSIETAPTWSPDGNNIAFTSDRSGSPQIYIMDAEGSNVRRLTYIGGYNDSPCWSPKGDRIIFVSRDDVFKICSIDVLGGNLGILAELGNNENPSFSPDGNHVVFSSSRLGDMEIYAMDLFGGGLQRITQGGGCFNPAWSPRRR